MNATARTVQFGLTPRQQECLDAIKAHIATHRCAPTRGELADALGLRSKGHVNLMLASLEARGWIKVQPNAARAIVVLSETDDDLSPAVEAALQAHCERTGERRADIINDAVMLFLDGVAYDGDDV
ncbi:hypothetical protein X566_01395 [Afipia sp. P52-10]|uniref:LexA family protein n=1 Tax=Afipia sp. P52-10 TaxID=1429916 RepID=UPI0003DF1200|nr:hypothetical protein [Afipia sp. P52-10]ETR79316.1 hypothetical protein X566_01395 [Afipia sp. P52-10]